MQHFVFFYLIFSFGVLFSSVLAFSVFYFKYKAKILKYYSILILTFVVRLFIFLHTHFLDSIIAADVSARIVNLVLRFAWGGCFILIAPRFYFYLVEQRITPIKWIVITAVAAAQAVFVVLPFLLYRTPVAIHDALQTFYVYVDNCIFAFFLGYFIINALGRYRQVKGPLSQKLIRVNGALAAILIPVLIIDILEKGGVTDFLPGGLKLIYIYSVVYSVVHLKIFHGYFMKKIEIAVVPERVPDSFIAVNGITGRESDILSLLLDNFTYKKIAETLFISERTVECHVSNIYRKTNVGNRSELIELIKAHSSVN